MEIRKASFKDIDEIMQIYDHAKVFMRENGNKDQWEDGYPGRKLIEEGLDRTYLCVENGRTACVFTMQQKRMKTTDRSMADGSMKNPMQWFTE